MARTAANVEQRDAIRTGKGGGKVARKQFPPDFKKKIRNVKPYKDKWAQIKFAYISKDIPMPTSYYKKQVEWFETYTSGKIQEEYLNKLKKYYDDNKDRLDAEGKAPVGQLRRESKKRVREEEKEEEKSEEQPQRTKNTKKKQYDDEARDMWRTFQESTSPMTKGQMKFYTKFFTHRGYRKHAELIRKYYEEQSNPTEPMETEKESVNEEEYQQSKKKTEEEQRPKSGESYKIKLNRVKNKIGNVGAYITEDDPIPEEELNEILEEAQEWGLTDEDVGILLQYNASHNENTRRANKKRDAMKVLLESAFGGNVRVRQALLKAMNDADLVKDKLGEVMDLVFH